MTEKEVVALVEPLVRHKAFPSTEEAVRELVAGFVLRQIDRYRERIAEFEKRHGMTFEQFGAYLKERSMTLTNGQLDEQQKKKVAQAVMQEEEDWLDWRIARDFLNGWLGLKAEAVS
ncbi:MAG: hypothetical protein AAB382_07855 [Chloroflexota bacterium]